MIEWFFYARISFFANQIFGYFCKWWSVLCFVFFLSWSYFECIWTVYNHSKLKIELLYLWYSYAFISKQSTFTWIKFLKACRFTGVVWEITIFQGFYVVISLNLLSICLENIFIEWKMRLYCGKVGCLHWFR